MSARAFASSCPSTSGMAWRSGPFEMITVTLVPRKVREPAAGSLLMTDPTGTSSEKASWVVKSRLFA